jgi:hypothetical protein
MTILLGVFLITGASLATDATTTDATTTASTATEKKSMLVPNLSVDVPTITFSTIIEKNGSLHINYIGDYISGMYVYLLQIGTIISIIMIMIGGLQWTMSGGSMMGDYQKSSATGAKKRITNAVSGLVLLLSVYMLLFIINPELIGLKPVVLTNVEYIALSNETSDDFYENFETVARIGNGVGWNDVPMWSQKEYASVPYGPDECLEEKSGNIKSSGCGVTSFAMVLSSLSSSIDPPTVAASFWKETEETGAGFRPTCNDSKGPDGKCGCSGTHVKAFWKSELLAERGLKGRVVRLGEYEEIYDLLSKGKLIIALYKTEGGGGHYVVLTGIDPDDETMLLVNDPYGGKKDRRPKTWLEGTMRAAAYVDKEADFIDS